MPIYLQKASIGPDLVDKRQEICLVIGWYAACGNSYEKKGWSEEILLLIMKRLRTAIQGHKASERAVRMTSAPCSLVDFVEGMQKSKKLVPLRSLLKIGLEDRITLNFGFVEERLRTVSSPRQQEAKKCNKDYCPD
jgi:hypothetical protein